MRNTPSWLKQAFFSVIVLGGVALAPSSAQASPGTCSCNSGCHDNVGQCVKGASCSKGYAPACGARTPDSGSTTCPKVGSVSCDGVCNCTPIPFFCDTVGGAEYCPDAGTDGGTTGDAGKSDGSTPLPDATPTPDAKLPPEDAPATLPDGGKCPPPSCPPGTRTIVIPKQCDPYCAQPCGTGEFKCPPGLACVEGWCVPGCLATACTGCQSCDLSAGSCYDDPALCGDGGIVGGDSGGFGDDGGDAGDPLSADPSGTAKGGCGCATVGSNNDTVALMGAFGVLIALGLARRPRKR